MSRRVLGHGAQQRKGPKLPFVLQQRLGLQGEAPRGRGRRTQVSDRKALRKNARITSTKPPPRKRARIEEEYEDAEEDDAGQSLGEEEEESMPRVASRWDNDDNEDESASSEEDASESAEEENASSRETPTALRSARRSRSPSASDAKSLDEQIARIRELSPEMNLDASSRSYRSKEAEDDAEIAALEKRLGMKGGKKSKKQEFDDGFDAVLEDIEDGNPNKSQGRKKREEDEWLQQKRDRQVQQQLDRPEPDSDVDEDESSSSGLDFEGFDDQEEIQNFDTAPIEKPRQRENPYVAPVSTSQPSAAKYVPPSLRKAPQTDAEQLERLKRQAQGFLNKLSEANLISIVSEFEKLYQTHPRQDVTTVIIDLILTAFTIRSSLQNTYIILHAAFVSALYKVLGSDFGAELVSKLVETFDKHHQTSTDTTGKECLNLISLLSNLFTFNVITSNLIYDHIRLLLTSFNEVTAELLLRCVRDCGPQLRADDPTSLKGIVSTINTITAQMTRQSEPINVRTRVMIDTITDLKNNKIRQATNAAGATGEHITKMRKALGSLNNRQLRGTEPLGISRDDIANSDKKGKWWLVGASWKGHDSTTTPNSASHPQTTSDDDLPMAQDEPDYQSLASHYKMNTPTRRAIFIAILTATDARDCLTRLQKLRLTRKQEPEIARVLLRCCRAEATYNPYYTVIARKLITQDRKLKMSFSIALWKFFGELGEKHSIEDDESDREAEQESTSVQIGEVANLSKMYAALIMRGTLGMDVLKTLSIGMTGEDTSLFLELLLVTILTDAKTTGETTAQVFESVPAHMVSGLEWFLKKTVARSDFAKGNEARKRLNSRLKVAKSVLSATAQVDDVIDSDN